MKSIQNKQKQTNLIASISLINLKIGISMKQFNWMVGEIFYILFCAENMFRNKSFTLHFCCCFFNSEKG